MSGRKLLRKFSSSISDLLSLQRRDSLADIESTTPFHHAVQTGNSIMVSNFVETKSIWIDEEDGKGRTALHYSMEQCNLEIASILLKGGANVDCVDYDGISACHIACKEGMIDHFNLLLYYHADVCSIDKLGRTPFDLACEHGQEKMIDRLMSCGVKRECFFNAGETHTASALHLASSNGHVQIVSRLLENGWDINRVTPQGSALHLASGCGTTQVVRFLLRAGINTNLRNANDQTAIEFAKKNTHKNPITYKEIRYLLKSCKQFVNAIATREHCGNKADELSFSPGDKIWVIERNESGHWKGTVFGQKGNSRSGYFHSSTVIIKEEIEAEKLRSISTPNLDISMSSMSSRLMMPPNAQSTPHPGRHTAKPVPVPVVPNSATSFNRKDRNDFFMNNRIPMSSFGRAPSGMSDSSSDSHNGNRRQPSMTQSSFSSYGTNTATMLGSNRMLTSGDFKGQSSMFPSTSALPPMAGASTQNTADSHRVSTGSNSSHGSSGFESMKCSASSSSSFYLQNSLNESSVADGQACRTNANSASSGSGSGSSMASTSVHTLDDSFHSASTAAQTPNAVNVTHMVANGVPTAEVLANWLDSINMSDYLSLFLRQGYDLFSIARATPEDLLSLGIKNPEHRKKLIFDIHGWGLQDTWPNVVPIGGLREWLHSIALAEYITTFENQGYNTVEDILNLTWEDFEDIGVKRLGHLKRFGLAIKKIKDCRRAMASMPSCAQPMPQSRPRLSSPLLNRNQSNSGLRMNDPPPPAPSGFYQPKMGINDKIDYISYTRGGKCAPPPPVRQPAVLDQRRNVRSSYDALFAEDEPIRLNLVSTGKILSDISKMNKDKDQDFGYYDESEDCPPPPAPLYCEANPLRLLPFRSSMCSTGSTSSTEQIPFANENCGTIKSARDSAKFDFPSSLPPLLPVETNRDKRSAPSVVYDDLEQMMQNLCGDLLKSRNELSNDADVAKKSSAKPNETH